MVKRILGVSVTTMLLAAPSPALTTPARVRNWLTLVRMASTGLAWPVAENLERLWVANWPLELFDEPEPVRPSSRLDSEVRPSART